MSENTPSLLRDRVGHTLVLTLNRPEVLNAVDRTVHELLGNALEEADRDPAVWVVVLTGSGDRAFCAGADLRALARGESLLPDEPRQRAWGFAGYAAHPISKPTIAAVNGVAYGGGAELVLASDLVVASDTATFGLTEVRRGIIAAGGGAFRLPRQIAPKVGNELLFTGDAISAHRALDLGLINQVVPPAEVLTAALALADRINANAPLAVQATKRLAARIDRSVSTDESADWARADREFAAIMTTADAHEGPTAFAQKRPPVWSGT